MDQRPARLWSRLAASAAGLASALPLILAVWGAEGVPAPRPLAAEKETSNLAFIQYAVNRREVRATASAPAHFDFWNKGDRSIEILKLEPSCGCLSTWLRGGKRHYAPGEQGQFSVEVMTANEAPGPKAYTVRMHYSDGQPREQLVTYRLTIPERKVTVNPSELFFYALSGDSISADIQVEDHRGRELNVLEAIPHLDGLLVSVGEKRELRPGVWATPLSARVQGPIAAGRRNGNIVIRTDDPDYPRIVVPVIVFGPQPGLQLTSGEFPDATSENNSDGAKP